MRRSGRRKWAQARSLAEVGELMAQWLEGRITYQPAYGGDAPERETEPIRHLLAACCRAGYVTTCSQPGAVDRKTGEPCQRAAVEGFCDPAAWSRLGPVAYGAGLIVIAHDPAKVARCRLRLRGGCCRWCTRLPGAVPVTRWEGSAERWFGSRRSHGDLRDIHVGYGECHPDAVRAITRAWQVTLIEREWGANAVLWPLLERWASSVTTMAGAGAP